MSKAQVEIEYCHACRFLMRAAWMAQELLSTFGAELETVALRPGVGGVFRVSVNGDTVVWDRKAEGRFPETKELKLRVRELVAPELDLGPLDKLDKKA
jgi:selenoprotein W-related protein